MSMNLMYKSVFIILIANVIGSLLILSTVAAIYGIFYFNDIALISMALNYCFSFDVKIQELYIAWRVAVCRVWRVPWKTHNNMLAHIGGLMDSEFFFEKRCIKLIKMGLVSENCTVCTISNMGRYGSHSIMGGNFKHLNRKYCVDESNVYIKWKHVCVSNKKLIRKCMQVKELINMQDRCMNEWGI